LVVTLEELQEREQRWQGSSAAAMGAPAMALAADRRRRMEREWGGK